MNPKIKEFVRNRVKSTKTYRNTRRLLESPFEMSTLEKAVREAVENVPYYKNNKVYRNALDEGEFDITRFPILTKSDVAGHEKEFVSKRFFKPLLRAVTTGGSSGESLNLYYSPTLSIARTAMPDILYEQFLGTRPKYGILRGINPGNNRVWRKLNNQMILFSSYILSASTLPEYIDVLEKEKINSLEAYPSSLTVLAKLIKEEYGVADLPNLKFILVSSEIFSREDKLIVNEVFPNATIVDYYCMSEFVTAAYSVGLGNVTFNNNYGYVELLPTPHTTPEGNRICEIVATSIMNTTMPFIRYNTGDCAEVDAEGNVVSILGRTSDYAVNQNSQLVPCIVVFRNEAMQNVEQFQFYQDTVGELQFRVMVNNAFGEKDKRLLEEDLTKCFAGLMQCEAVVTTELEHTRIGKLKRMVQKLNLAEYK